MVGPCRPQFVLFGSSIVQISYSFGGWGAILADLYARKADIVLRGYSGWNSRLALQVLDQVFPKDAAVQPSLVIVYFGGNDAMKPHPSGLGAHVPLPEYVENMKKIAVHLKILDSCTELNLEENGSSLFPISGPGFNVIMGIFFFSVNLEKPSRKISGQLQSLSEKTRLIFLTCPPVNEAEIREYFGNALDDQERTNELCGIYAEALVELCRVLDVKVINLWTAIQQRDDWETACFLDGIHLSSEGSKIVAKEILKVLKEADWEPSLYWMSMPAEFSEDSPYYTVGPDGKSTVNVSRILSHLHKEWVNI